MDEPLQSVCLLASSCCLALTQFIRDSEIWALEEISSEYSGVRLFPRCALGHGTLVDLHVGMDHVRVEHVVAGSAVSQAFSNLSVGSADQVAISTDMWMLMNDAAKSLGIESRSASTDVIILEISDTIQFRKNVDSVKESASDHIAKTGARWLLNSDRPVVRSAKSYLQSHLPDIVTEYLDEDRKNAWKKRHLQQYETILHVHFEFADQDAALASLQHLCFMLIRNSKANGFDFIKLLPSGASNFMAVILVDREMQKKWDTSTEVAAVEACIHLREEMIASQMIASQISCAINFMVSSRRLYLNILETENTCTLRLLGGSVEFGILLGQSMGGNLTDAISIFVDKNTSTKLQQTNKKGYISGLRNLHLTRKGFHDWKGSDYRGWVAPKQVTVPAWDVPRRCIDKQSVFSKKEQYLAGSFDSISESVKNYVEKKEKKTIGITGPAGSGKTHLLRHAFKLLESKKVSTCTARAPERGSYNLLNSVGTIMCQLFDLMKTHCFQNQDHGHKDAKRVHMQSDESSKSETSEMETKKKSRTGSAVKRFLRNSFYQLDSQKSNLEASLPESADREYLGMVRACLELVGLEPNDMLPLLNSVLPINVPENDFSKNIGFEGRAVILGRILSMLGECVSIIQPLAFLVDDAERYVPIFFVGV
ncbi:hypothetical protein HDU97_004797 [Phlyctochytrium planicorne]|nr:hypothetical protein HDU97_004797 [Phlyctochytrium planicorne]